METPQYAAPGSRTLSEILTDLRKPIASRHLSSKKAGRSDVVYVHHAVIRDYLDLYAPGWEWTLRAYGHEGKMYVMGTLTLVGTDGRISRDGIGNEDSDLDSFGDPSSNAEAQALRRAAMAFGFCRPMWNNATRNAFLSRCK